MGGPKNEGAPMRASREWGDPKGGTLQGRGIPRHREGPKDGGDPKDWGAPRMRLPQL